MRPDEVERLLRERLDPSRRQLAPSCSTSSCSPNFERAAGSGELRSYRTTPPADTDCMKFEGDVAAFEAACLNDIRESLERCDRADYDCSTFRTLFAVELEGTFPDTAIVVRYRYKPRYDPKQEELRATFPIWSEELPVFKPFAPSSDEMWSEAGEQEVFLWFIEPDGPD
jgi:hypothetical protein